MMRRRKPHEEPKPGLDMSSLIDVSFLLLIYFFVTSTLDPKEADLGMTMPGRESSSPFVSSIDYAHIEVDGEGRIAFNEEVLDTDADSRELPLLLDRLRLYVQAAALTGSETFVVIEADDAVKGQRFVDVLNALAEREIGIDNVTLNKFRED